MTFPFETRYEPPFPALQVVLRNDHQDRSAHELSALLDTGADGTLVPIDHLWQIRATPIRDARIRSHWDEPRRVQLFVADVGIGRLVLPGVIVVGDEVGDEVILGRNVLNKLRLLLDGPAATTTLRASEAALGANPQVRASAAPGRRSPSSAPHTSGAYPTPRRVAITSGLRHLSAARPVRRCRQVGLRRDEAPVCGAAYRQLALRDDVMVGLASVNHPTISFSPSMTSASSSGLA